MVHHITISFFLARGRQLPSAARGPESATWLETSVKFCCVSLCCSEGWWISWGFYSWMSGWWFGTCFTFPYIGNNHSPNWLIFFRGVQTTNQMKHVFCSKKYGLEMFHRTKREASDFSGFPRNAEAEPAKNGGHPSYIPFLDWMVTGASKKPFPCWERSPKNGGNWGVQEL